MHTNTISTLRRRRRRSSSSLYHTQRSGALALEVEGEREARGVDLAEQRRSEEREHEAQRDHADGVEVDLGLREERQRPVAQVRHVEVGAEGGGVEQVGEQHRGVAAAQQQRQQEELQHVQQQEEREEGVAVDVEGVEPLHLLCHGVCVGLQEVSVGDEPADGGDGDAEEEPVHDDAVHDEAQVAADAAHVEGDAVGERGEHEESHLRDGEGRVVARPLVLHLLAVEVGLVNAVGVARRQGQHLVERGLEVHLPKVQDAAEVLGHGRRHRHAVPGVAHAAGVQGQHGGCL
mmetsp:Transcript_31841/g.101299  ORF Transcript_31841/g.101299 Transcript_31841/m.101299 type:complete len:290 (+) Transcript_31841:1801-2670(+)